MFFELILPTISLQLNKTDVGTLSQHFASFHHIVRATPEELASCPGFGTCFNHHLLESYCAMYCSFSVHYPSSMVGPSFYIVLSTGPNKVDRLHSIFRQPLSNDHDSNSMSLHSPSHPRTFESGTVGPSSMLHSPTMAESRKRTFPDQSSDLSTGLGREDKRIRRS